MAAGWLIYRNVKGGKADIKYSYVLKCTNPACTNPHPDKTYVESYPRGQKPPFPCPYCGGRAYIALKCRACGGIFPLVRNSGPGPPYDCPYCRRRRTVYPLEPGHVSPGSESPNP